MSNDILKVHDFLEDLKQNEINGYCLKECEMNQCCTNLTNFALPVDARKILFLFGDEMTRQHPTISRTKNGAERLLRLKVKELCSQGRLSQRDDGLLDFLGPQCPRYDQSTKRCEVHGDPRRPYSCPAFPINLEGQNALMDARCDFIKGNWEDLYRELQKYHAPGLSINVRCNGITGERIGVYELPKEIEAFQKRLEYGLK